MSLKTIVHAIDTGGPGGAETIFLQLVDRLAAAGWHSVAVVPERDWLHDALLRRGIEPVLAPTEGSYDIRYLRHLIEIARAHGASLIHTHLFTSSVYGSLAGRILRLPVVSTFHGQVDVAEDVRFKRLKARILTSTRNRTVFVSESLRQSVLRQLPLNPGRTRVVRNGIDASVFGGYTGDEHIRAELGVPRDAVLVGAVGNLRAPKDYPNLLRAAGVLRCRSAKYHFVIVGDTRPGELYGDLCRLRAQLNLEDAVTFTDFRDDVARILTTLDVFALSSDQEGFSLATVQAMAAGVPVVVTRSGGPEEIVTHEEDGLLVPARDSVALADAIERVASEDALRACLVSRARRTVAEHFSLDAMVRGYEAVYAELLGRRGKSADTFRVGELGERVAGGTVRDR